MSWTGFWNGFKELDHDVITEDMIKEVLVNDAKEKFVVLSGLMMSNNVGVSNSESGEYQS